MIDPACIPFETSPDFQPRLEGLLLELEERLEETLGDRIRLESLSRQAPVAPPRPERMTPGVEASRRRATAVTPNATPSPVRQSTLTPAISPTRDPTIAPAPGAGSMCPSTDSLTPGVIPFVGRQTRQHPVLSQMSADKCDDTGCPSVCPRVPTDGRVELRVDLEKGSNLDSLEVQGFSGGKKLFGPVAAQPRVLPHGAL